MANDPVGLVVEGRVFVIRPFSSELARGFYLIEKNLVGNGICLVASLVLLGLMMNIPPVIGLLSFVALHLNEDCKTLFFVLDCIKDCFAGYHNVPSLASIKFDPMKSSQKDFVHNFTGRYVENCFPLTLILPRIIIVNHDYPNFLKCCTLQFLAIRLVCSFFMIFLQLNDMYPLWLSWANVSVTLAFFIVSAFFRAFLEEFPPRMLTAKFFYFIKISGVCFFQGSLFKVLVAIGVIKSNQFCNSLLAFEMMLLSLFQCLAFSPGPYNVSHSSLQMGCTNLDAIPEPKRVRTKKGK